MSDNPVDDSTSSTVAETSLLSDEPETVFVESNVSLYRYGGFALHSLLKKHESEVRVSSSRDRDIVIILKQLKIKDEQMSQLPKAIHLLNQGGLYIMNPYIHHTSEK